jgi:hypothetical protein
MKWMFLSPHAQAWSLLPVDLGAHVAAGLCGRDRLRQPAQPIGAAAWRERVGHADQQATIAEATAVRLRHWT